MHGGKETMSSLAIAQQSNVKGYNNLPLDDLHDQIKALYIDRDMTLESVTKTLQVQFKMSVSRNMLKKKIHQWQLKKRKDSSLHLQKEKQTLKHVDQLYWLHKVNARLRTQYPSPFITSPTNKSALNETIATFQVYVSTGLAPRLSLESVEIAQPKELEISDRPKLSQPESINVFLGGIRDAFDNINTNSIEVMTQSLNMAFGALENIIRSGHFTAMQLVSEVAGLLILRGRPDICQIFLEQVHNLSLIIFKNRHHPVTIFTKNLLVLPELENLSNILKGVFCDLAEEILGQEDPFGHSMILCQRKAILNQRQFGALDLFDHAADIVQFAESFIRQQEWVYLEGVLWRWPDYVTRCTVGRMDTVETWSTNLRPLGFLGYSLASQGKYGYAETVLQQAVTLMSERLGAEHPTTLETMGYLNGCLAASKGSANREGLATHP